MARREGAANGEANPHNITHLATTRQRAAKLMNTRLTGNGPCYLVELHGHFSGTGVPIPAGHKAPTGTTMLLVGSAATRMITDLGIANHIASLSSIGTPERL